MSKKILEFGNQEQPLSEPLYPDAEIIVKPMIGEWWVLNEDYDGIYAFYAYHKTPLHLEQRVLDNWKNCLVPGGILHIIVPSWTYLCRMALQPMIQPWLKPLMIDCSNWFTMGQLRILFARSGLNVLKAKTGAGQLALGEWEFELEQHYIAGQRPDEGS